MVGPNGEQVGIVRVEDALRLAAEADLDLVEVAPMAKPPVAKLMDFGKYKYEAAMKAREARKNQVNTVIKEIKLRPKIDPHDYGTKKGHVERFLKGGDKVKVTIMFRGREQSRPELGYRLLQRLAEDILELGIVESSPKQDGRNMVMVIAPTKKKAQAMAEQRRKRDEDRAPGHEDPYDQRATETDEVLEATETDEDVRSRSDRDRGGRAGPRGRGDRRGRADPRGRGDPRGRAGPHGRAGPRGRAGHRGPRRPCRPPSPRRSPRRPPQHPSRRPDRRPTNQQAPPNHHKEIGTMPKNKTHSGAKKRFRVTGTGKIMREQAGHVHKFHEKTPQKARALSKDILVSKGDLKKVKKLLGR